MNAIYNREAIQLFLEAYAGGFTVKNAENPPNGFQQSRAKRAVRVFDILGHKAGYQSIGARECAAVNRGCSEDVRAVG